MRGGRDGRGELACSFFVGVRGGLGGLGRGLLPPGRLCPLCVCACMCVCMCVSMCVCVCVSMCVCVMIPNMFAELQESVGVTTCNC